MEALHQGFKKPGNTAKGEKKNIGVGQATPAGHCERQRDRHKKASSLRGLILCLTQSSRSSAPMPSVTPEIFTAMPLPGTRGVDLSETQGALA